MIRPSIALVFVISLWTASSKAQDPDLRDEKTWPVLVRDQPLKVGENEDQVTKLMKKRYNAALDELRTRFNFWIQSEGRLAQICDNADRVVSSRMEIESQAADKIRLLKQKLNFAMVVERRTVALAKTKSRAQNILDQKFARYYRLNVEIELARVSKRAKNPDQRK